MLTTNALTGIKEYIKRTVSYARYKVGSAYYKADLTDVYIDGSGIVMIDLMIDHTVPGDITVTEVQLFDTSGQLWASKAEHIDRENLKEGIFYRFTISITEL